MKQVGGAKQEEDAESDLSESGSESEEDLTFKQKTSKYIIYVLTCRCFNGATVSNYLELAMNVFSLCDNIFMVVYSNKIHDWINEAV